MTTGGFGSGAVYRTVAATVPVAGSIRSKVPFPYAYSELPAATSESWVKA